MIIGSGILLLSCNQGSTDKPEDEGKPGREVQSASPEKEKKKKISKPKYPRLNNENCVDFLSEYGKENPETRVLIKTKFGDIEVELFAETPLHRANFLYLIERGYYTKTEIVRVVENFIVQGGNSEETGPAEQRFLIGQYTLPPEYTPDAVHLKGALAMSRRYENNPRKRSSAYDFYIVHGKKIGMSEIYDAQQKRDYTDEQLDKYKTVGGAIHLDQEHTVFGRVVSGLSVVDEMAKVETDKSGWPKQYIEVNMEVLP